MTAERDAWLRLTIEDPIDPDLPICDPHHHLWDRPNDRYFLDEFIQDASTGHRIVSTVFIECGAMYSQDVPETLQVVGETEFAQGIAAQSASGQYGPTRVALGIVGHANLRLGSAVAPVLEAHLAASPNRFRGIRHSCSWDASQAVANASTNPPEGLLLDAKFREGFACLQRYGLSFEAWLYHPQLPELADLARVFPDIPIVLNHVGGLLGIGPYTGRREEVFEQWKVGIAQVARCPNVLVKLGGLGMTRCGFAWEMGAAPPTSAELADALAPYYLWCIDQFGVERCMFESNFPVDKASYSYANMWNAFKRITQTFSPAQRLALFHDNAVRVYRLASAPVSA